jgi:hypothetical protein
MLTFLSLCDKFKKKYNLGGKSMFKLAKKVFSFFLFAMTVVAIISLSNPLSVSASLSGSNIVNGIDYSGQGTKIDGQIAPGVATVSGNTVNVPIYRGKYEAGVLDGWWLHSWSNWSIFNNMTNDYYTFRGNTALEYNVESREEHRYRRWDPNLNPVYNTMYHTEYRRVILGISFYSTESSWDGYPGPKANHTINARWTTSEIRYYNGGWTDHTGYLTSPPFRWPWEPEYQIYMTRTSYRYRSRTMTWNEQGATTTESVPLRYSLKDRNDVPIQFGIKIVANHTISPRASTSLFNPTPDNWDYDLTIYYLDTNVLEAQLYHVIMSMHTTDPFILQLKAMLEITGSSVFAAIGVLSTYFAKNAVLAGLGAITSYAAAIILPLNIVNIWLQYNKAISYNNLVDNIALWSEYNYIGIAFKKYFNLDNQNMLFPIRNMAITLLDRKDSSNDNLSHISLRLSNNQFSGSQGQLPNPYMDLGLDYFGIITYVDNLSELEQDMQTYFDSYDIFSIFSWIGL